MSTRHDECDFFDPAAKQVTDHAIRTLALRQRGTLGQLRRVAASLPEFKRFLVREQKRENGGKNP